MAETKPKWMKDAAEEIFWLVFEWEKMRGVEPIPVAQERENMFATIISKHCPQDKAAEMKTRECILSQSDIAAGKAIYNMWCKYGGAAVDGWHGIASVIHRHKHSEDKAVGKLAEAAKKAVSAALTGGLTIESIGVWQNAIIKLEAALADYEGKQGE